MANIQRINGKKGIAYKLTAFCGYDSHGKQVRRTKTWKPSPGMTARQAEKEAAYQAESFEEAVNNGTAIDGNIRFADYAERWLSVNEPRFAPITHARYKTLLIRICQAIGHLRIAKITPIHLK
jgi:D-alanine-D-alanine ligase-like ATP-grasp enzyme